MRLSKTDKIHKFRENFVKLAYEKYGRVVDRPQLEEFCETNNFAWPSWLVKDRKFRVKRGLYKLPIENLEIEEKMNDKLKETTTVNNYSGTNENTIPKKDPLYVPFGQYKLIKKIISSGNYYPVFVTGLSGNGKTFMIEQACAEAKRNLFRVNITVETDEDDLLGGFRLLDGETVWFNGPVVKAMLTGSVLLLDEIDLASSKILCLQPVLEGKGVFLKKINQYVKPKPGFTVVATANTKGKGSEDGRFIGTNILNEAFLERFPITIEQDYPSKGVESRILKRVFKTHEMKDDEYIQKLTQWADTTRSTFNAGAIDELISTRRLVHIANAYAILGDKQEAIDFCINRFDYLTKEGFLQLWSMLNLSPEELEEKNKVEAEETDLTRDETKNLSYL